jgi:hypothetical protein
MVLRQPTGWNIGARNRCNLRTIGEQYVASHRQRD